MLLGSDPEFPIRSHSGAFIPAHRVFGDQANKRGVSADAVAFRDGFMVELNVKPQETALALVRAVQQGIRGVNKLLPSKWELATNAAITINPKKDLRAAPPDVLHFGCTPSYCAYSGQRKVVSADPMTLTMRCAGAHMHFSASVKEIETGSFGWLMDPDSHRLFIRMLDAAIGLPLARIYHAKGQYERRTLYGQAGEYRPQEYPDGSLGLEYRTPPPDLWNDAGLAVRMFAIGAEVFRTFRVMAKIWDSRHEAAIRAAIDTGAGLRDAPLLGYFGVTEKMVDHYFTEPVYRRFQLPYQQL